MNLPGFVIIYVFLLFFELSTAPHLVGKEFYVVSQPTRIGGTVTIGSSQLTNNTSFSLRFIVTDQNGKAFEPVAEDNDGLNNYFWYVINIPVYDPINQPGGAKYGDIGCIHVYNNNRELKISDPVNGEFIIGSAGSVKQIDLILVDDLTMEKGDINEDGLVDLKDLIVVLNSCVGNYALLPSKEGKLNQPTNIMGAIYIVRLIGKITEKNTK